MGKREIEVVIRPDGSVELRPVGMKGPDCVEATRELEEALGVVVDRQRTPEFYERPGELSRSWVGGSQGADD